MTILIVDDEPLVKEILFNHIDWKNLRISRLLSSSDGYDALDILKKESVDIVISDIVMPRCDGLEMIETMHSMGMNIPVILISGYCDKEYLIKAIHLGVVDFIEKPIQLENVYKCVASAVKRITRKSADEMRPSHCSIDDEFLYAISSGNYTEIDRKIHALASVLKYENIGLYLTGPLISNQYMDDDFVLTVNEFASRSWIRFCHFEGKRIGILILYNEKLADELTSFLNSLFSDRLSFGFISGSVSSSVSDLYDKASAASSLEFYGNGATVYHWHEHKMTEGWLPVEKYIPAIRTDRRKLKQFIHEDFLRLRRHMFINIDYVRSEIWRLYEAVFDYYCEMCPGITSASDFGKKNNFMFYPLASIEQYLFLMLDGIDQVAEMNTFSIPVIRAVDYIHLHFMDADLGVPAVAASACVSVPYMCRIFKREKKMTVNQYIQDYRLRMAEKIISSRHVMVWETAQAVGFDDVAYFSKLFKKKYGCLPSKYRRNH